MQRIIETYKSWRYKNTWLLIASFVVFFYLAGTPFVERIITTMGSLGYFIIFRFFKDHVFEELRPIFSKLGNHPLLRILSTPYFAWVLPVLGAFIIASPFPDEVGIGLMGISRMKSWQFLILAFVLNSTGIFFIVTLARSF